MKPLHPSIFRLSVLLLCFFLAACGVIPGLSAPQKDTGPTSTPLPTSSAPDFPILADPTCRLATFEPLRTNQPQGDLLAWMPEENSLAYVGPAPNSNWYAGTLRMAPGPGFQSPVTLTPDVRVFGSLLWSPDGSTIAFVAFRQTDNVFTVMTTPREGGPASDWLPDKMAHTDSGSSMKSVKSWQAGRRLRAVTACGPDCDQVIDINTNNGEVSTFGEQTRFDRKRLQVSLRQLTYDEKKYPLMLTPNWSPDGKKITFVDENDYARVLWVDGKSQSILDTGLATIREAKWSYDSRLLAIRTDDLVYVIDTECKK